MEATAIAVNFGGVRAVDGVSLSVQQGEIHGLIGPNGSGKTTFLNAISGFVRMRAGRILLNGIDATSWSVHKRALAGVARTFQAASIFSEMTAIDNVIVGLHAWDEQTFARACLPGVSERLAAKNRSTANRSLSLVGLAGRGAAASSGLAFGQQRMLDLARATAGPPRLLLMDEPAAGLSRPEVEELSSILGNLRRDGWSVLLVEHHMRFVMGMCDVITVLNFGRRIAVGPPSQIRGDRAVIEAYLGPDDGDTHAQ
jgi:branched-chain amino acid transport system ATP-binding protein